MKNLSWALLASTSFVAACTQSDGEAPSLPASVRESLERFGVTTVTRTDQRLTLEDNAGRTIGEVVLTDPSTIDATLAGNHVHSSGDSFTVTAECNAAGISLPRVGWSTDATARAVLSPCDDVLRVTAILLGASADRADAASLQSGCTFLGANTYCSGSTAVSSFDWLCYNNDGSSQHVNTTTYFDPDSWYCAN